MANTVRRKSSKQKSTTQSKHTKHSRKHPTKQKRSKTGRKVKKSKVKKSKKGGMIGGATVKSSSTENKFVIKLNKSTKLSVADAIILNLSATDNKDNLEDPEKMSNLHDKELTIGGKTITFQKVSARGDDPDRFLPITLDGSEFGDNELTLTMTLSTGTGRE